MAPSASTIVPAALLRRREKWLKAIETGDIKAALKAGGHALSSDNAGPELEVSDVDVELDKLRGKAESVQEKQDFERLKTLRAEIKADLEAHEGASEGMSVRQRQAGMRSIKAKMRELESVAASCRTWSEDVRFQRGVEFRFFGASPVEAMLRAGNLAGLSEALRLWGAPKRRYLRGFYGNRHDAGWTSRHFLPYGALDWAIGDAPLVGLAAIRGDVDALHALVRAGLCPTGQFGWLDQHDALLRLDEQKTSGSRPLLARALKQYGMARGGLSAAANRMARQADLDQALEDAFGRETYGKGGRKKALGLLAKGASVGYFPLARATEEDDIEMLEALFAAGGDPNCVYRDAVPLLAKLNTASAKAVRVWLRHGACPLMLHDPASPDFGDDWRPSPLYQAVWEGNLDMTRLLLEEAVIAPVIAYKEGRKFANPMADLAKGRGHAKLAAYLKDYATRMKA